MEIAKLGKSTLETVKDIMICGFPAHKVQISYETKFSLFQTDRKTKISSKEGLIEYKLLNTLGMSGSPLLIKGKKEEYFVVGIHWG